MENVQNSINLLKAVYNTMDGISITGIDNQDQFVGCANAVSTAIKQLEAFVMANSAKKEETDGGPVD